MTLGELIQALDKEDPSLHVKYGFTGEGYCDRGSYCDLEFEPKEGATVEEMLAGAKAAMGQTYTGYKGGDFKMSEYTTVKIGNWGECGEEISETLLRYAFESGWPEHRRRLKSIEGK